MVCGVICVQFLRGACVFVFVCVCVCAILCLGFACGCVPVLCLMFEVGGACDFVSGFICDVAFEFALEYVSVARVYGVCLCVVLVLMLIMIPFNAYAFLF